MNTRRLVKYLESSKEVEWCSDALGDNIDKEEKWLEDEQNDSGDWCEYNEKGVGNIVQNQVNWIDDPVEDGYQPGKIDVHVGIG